MEVERQVRRLQRTVIALVLILSIVYVGTLASRALTALNQSLVLRREGSSLFVVPMNDGPFVVTHVIARGGSEGDKRWAPLPAQIAIIDSEGASIDLSKLDWYDIRGEKAPPPTEQKLEVLYSIPNSVKVRSASED